MKLILVLNIIVLLVQGLKCQIGGNGGIKTDRDIGSIRKELNESYLKGQIMTLEESSPEVRQVSEFSKSFMKSEKPEFDYNFNIDTNSYEITQVKYAGLRYISNEKKQCWRQYEYRDDPKTYWPPSNPEVSSLPQSKDTSYGLVFPTQDSIIPTSLNPIYTRLPPVLTTPTPSYIPSSGYVPSQIRPPQQNPSGYLPTQQNPTGYLPPQRNPTGYGTSEHNPTGYLPTQQNPTRYEPPQRYPTGYGTPQQESQPPQYRPQSSDDVIEVKDLRSPDVLAIANYLETDLNTRPPQYQKVKLIKINSARYRDDNDGRLYGIELLMNKIDCIRKEGVQNVKCNVDPNTEMRFLQCYFYIKCPLLSISKGSCNILRQDCSLKNESPLL